MNGCWFNRHVTRFVESGCGWGVGSRGAIGECGGSGYVVAGCTRCRGTCANVLRGHGRAEVTSAGDWTDRLIDVHHPVELLRFMRGHIKHGVSCGRWWVILYFTLALLNPLLPSCI
jgi:hypothetical protein